MKFLIEPFHKKTHNRSNFNCSNSDLNDYLKELISQDISRDGTQAYIIRESDYDRILGFYTLSATSILIDEINPAHLKKLARYKTLPGILVGRLAVDTSMQGQKIGEKLLIDALERSLNLSKQLGISAVIVEAKTVNAAKFYKRYEFLEFASLSTKLYLPLNTIKQLFSVK